MAPEEHKLCMIPGPVEVADDVLSALATPATSHVDPNFIEAFGRTLGMMRAVFLADPSAQPFVVAGSGTLTWDMTAANLVEPGEAVLTLQTGVFGEWFKDCLTVYGASVDQVVAPFGQVPSLVEVEDALRRKPYKLITLTHVDTSTGVLLDVRAVSDLVRRISPTTLIAVDGVCSLGAEEFRQDAWGIDVAMTASQKAIGVPPGLALMVVSERAMGVAAARRAPPTTYYGSFLRWATIMRAYEARRPSYFATPPVQAILALETSLRALLERGMEVRFADHVAASRRFKDTIEAWGLRLVPTERAHAANTLSAIYYPAGIAPADLLKCVSGHGVVIAGGLHPQHREAYFRVGHMHLSVLDSRDHMSRTVEALERALKVEFVRCVWNWRSAVLRSHPIDPRVPPRATQALNYKFAQ